MVLLTAARELLPRHQLEQSDAEGEDVASSRMRVAVEGVEREVAAITEVLRHVADDGDGVVRFGVEGGRGEAGVVSSA